MNSWKTIKIYYYFLPSNVSGYMKLGVNMGSRIKDVAKEAGVSTATVSRVINNSPSTTEETRKKILAAMEKLSYVPNSLAQGLASKKVFNVTLIIDIEDAKSFSNPFFYEVMHGIETVMHEQGLSLIIASSHKADNRINSIKKLVHGKRMQGLIIPSSLADTKTLEKLNELDCPFVIVGEPTQSKGLYSWVDINNTQGGEQAVEHLAGMEYKKIAIICGSTKELFNYNRLLGYKNALQRNEIAIAEEYIKECDSTKKDAYIKTLELLALKDAPDAIICGDNIISFGSMKAIKEKGLDIPDDIGLVSFDDYPLAELVEPSLTSIDIDVFELGAIAANALIKMMNNPDARQQQSLLSTGINIRESSQRKNN